MLVGQRRDDHARADRADFRYDSASNASLQIPVRETIVSNVPKEREAGVDGIVAEMRRSNLL